MSATIFFCKYFTHASCFFVLFSSWTERTEPHNITCTLYRIYNKTEKTEQMHISSCIEDEAKYSLHLHSQVLSHAGREIPWFTEIHARPLDQQRTGTSRHTVDFIHLHLRNLDLLPLLAAACLARPLNHTKHQLSFVIYPHQSRVSSKSLKLYRGKGFFFPLPLLKQQIYLENKQKEQSLCICNEMEDISKHLQNKKQR